MHIYGHYHLHTSDDAAAGIVRNCDSMQRFSAPEDGNTMTGDLNSYDSITWSVPEGT